MLIGVAGGVLLAGEMNGSGFGSAQAALSVGSAELNRHPRGPLPKTKPASWITEYPSGALQAELQGRLVTRLEVDAFGEPWQGRAGETLRVLRLSAHQDTLTLGFWVFWSSFV